MTLINLLPELKSFIQGLIFFSLVNTIVFTIIMLLLSKHISRYNGRLEKAITVLLTGSLVAYLVVYSVSLSNRFRSDIWNFSYVILIALVFLSLKYPGKSLFQSILRVTALTVLASSLMFMLINYTKLFTPLLPDTGRYIVQTNLMLKEGVWRPYYYAENPYYQILKIQSYLPYYILSTIGIGDVRIGYFIASIAVFTSMVMVLLALSLNIVRKELASSSTLLLLLITPPLLIIPITYSGQAISIALALTTILLIVAYRKQQLPLTAMIIPMTLLIIVSTLSHIIGPLIILSIAFGITMYTRGKITGYTKILRTLTVVTLTVSLTYWFFTMILEDIIIHVSLSIYERILRYFEAAAPSITLAVYARVPVIISYSWTILPAIIAAYYIAYIIVRVGNLLPIVKSIIRRILGVKTLYSKVPYLVHSLNIISIIYLILIFILSLSGFSPRYAYRWVYPLLIIPSSYVFYVMVRKSSLKTFTLLSAIIISAALIATYDPQVVFERTGSLAIPSDYDYLTGVNLGKLLRYLDLPIRMDMRLGPGLSIGLYLRGYVSTLNSTLEFKDRMLVMIGLDSTGAEIAKRQLGSKYTSLYEEKGYLNYNIVYGNGKFIAFIIPKTK